MRCLKFWTFENEIYCHIRVSTTEEFFWKNAIGPMR